MALDDPLDEHEQSERVREWLRRNGFGLVSGVVLGLGAIFGWRWWDAQQTASQMKAGNDYQAAVKAIEAKDAKAAGLVRSLGDGMYGDLAALELAKSQAAAGQRDQAIATLRAISIDDPALREIRDQRVARLLIDAGKADEALKLVAGASSPTALEIVGDAELARGQRENARTAYSRALTQLEVGSPRRSLVELKLTEAGGSPAKPEAKS